MHMGLFYFVIRHHHGRFGFGWFLQIAVQMYKLVCHLFLTFRTPVI